MARLTNVKTGVAVNVDDSKVARFASADWVSSDAPEPEQKRSPGRPKKSDD